MGQWIRLINKRDHRKDLKPQIRGVVVRVGVCIHRNTPTYRYKLND